MHARLLNECAAANAASKSRNPTELFAIVETVRAWRRGLAVRFACARVRDSAIHCITTPLCEMLREMTRLLMCLPQVRVAPWCDRSREVVEKIFGGKDALESELHHLRAD